MHDCESTRAGSLCSRGLHSPQSQTQREDFGTGHLSRTSCHDLWKYHKVRTSGTYQIDVDDDGPLKPFWVDCEMGDGRDIHQVLTIVHHNLEDSIQVRGKELPGSYSRNVTYGDATEEHLTRLVDNMFSCQQYVRWDCKGAKFRFWYTPDLNSWWVGRDWKDQFYWGGAETDSRSCGCHPHCLPTPRNSTCNCDANAKQIWLADSGLLLDSSRLPVLQLRFGDTGEANEAGKHTLGPLICRASGHVEQFCGSLRAPVTITSYGYPSAYPPPFHRYLWTVTVEESDVMELIFLDYDVIHWGAYNAVPGCKAVVVVSAYRESDGRRVLIKRQDSAPPYFISDGSRTLVNLTFTTCNQETKKTLRKKGFMAEFRRSDCPGCEAGLGENNGETSCEGMCGVIASYGYPYPLVSYEPPMDYEHKWVLRVSPGRIVMLQFNDFDVARNPGPRTCAQESGVVAVYNGDSTDSENLIGGFCNLNRQGIVYSDTNVMTVIYRTRLRKIGNTRGFHATFREHMPQLSPKAVDFSFLRNVAKGKPALQNTTAEGHDAQKAVDGHEDSSCIATEYIADPWWQVNLQKEHLIYGVEIHNVPSDVPPPPIPTWPPGQYGLPMPVSGCPSSQGFAWMTGCRFHDVTYDAVADDKSPYWTDGIKLEGGLQEGGGVKQCFCMKTEETHLANSSYSWSPGSYCIFQYGDQCPDGFQSGYITWIDKHPMAAQARNEADGTLPKGQYMTHNTTLYFCCRNDGSTEVPIRLPTDRPFYLLQYDAGVCQKVQGLSVSEHVFRFLGAGPGSRPVLDVDTFGGMPRFKEGHPRVDSGLLDGGLVLYYCYYTIADSLRGFRVLVDNTGLISTFDRYYDEKNYGIPHATEENFLHAYMCALYPITELSQRVLRLNCTQPVLGQYVTLQIIGRRNTLRFCEFKVFAEEACGQPLGMASEEIFDSQLHASSVDESPSFHFSNARLNSEYGWCAAPSDAQRYIQVFQVEYLCFGTTRRTRNTSEE